MRIVVFLFGFPGIVLTALGGLILAFMSLAVSIAADLNATIDEGWLASPWNYPNGDIGLFFFLAAFYGFIGILFAMFRCGKQGAALLMLPLLGAAFLHPLVAVFAGLQAFTALLAFFVGPLPINAAPADADTDAEVD